LILLRRFGACASLELNRRSELPPWLILRSSTRWPSLTAAEAPAEKRGCCSARSSAPLPIFLDTDRRAVAIDDSRQFVVLPSFVRSLRRLYQSLSCDPLPSPESSTYMSSLTLRFPVSDWNTARQVRQSFSCSFQYQSPNTEGIS
jgi:hypothetical protein